ncbi:glycoside hydrolase family 13 protein [Leucogyrophana mollusca]|uniref:Glycoside hydrolase family 13 protein n=1 Tax=Leucogyrophana mollusca TaxID=85980 RepID=A0ACB8BQS4_9AGAM|nr:glycoside hydrolase family 13 protein [Leucogyrophana mollusca]
MLLIGFVIASLFPLALAATANQWRGRSIYQVIVDRYALPVGADPNGCPPGSRTWCGGTWDTIRENLDYIQNAGFTALWISPVSQNYEGPSTPYGDAYHGYWIADASQLNHRFGTSDDLKALSDELHRRGMYLMVDVVVNDVMSTSTNPDLSTYMFKDKSQYHPYCTIDWSNTTSEERCWLGDTVIPLADINTEDPTVVSAFGNWIQSLVAEYNIDGLRIDAAKHVNIDFWPTFCGKAGVFCIGEVFGSDINEAAEYQGPNSLDSILHYPMYNALVEAFTIPGPQNMSAVSDMIAQSKTKFKDPGLLGNFIENQDIPRWRNLSVDPQSLYNAMVFNFMSDGIPIVYYGQEQGFNGNADPYNREALWTSGYANSTTYQLISTLNQFRNFLVNTTGWVNSEMQVLATTKYGISILKGNVVSIMTNIGSPPQNVSVPVYTPFESSTATTNILTCEQWAVGSNGTVDAQYSLGGVPVVLIPSALLEGSGLCGYNAPAGFSKHTSAASTLQLSVFYYVVFLSSCLGVFKCML